MYSRRTQLAEQVWQLQCAMFPASRWQVQPALCVADTEAYLGHLYEAMLVFDKSLFTAHICWLHRVLQARAVPSDHLLQNLQAAKTVLRQQLTETAGPLAELYLTAACHAIEQGVAEGPLLAPAEQGSAAAQYLQLLLAGQRQAAYQLVQQLLASRWTLQEVYLHIFQASQYRIGQLWQENELSVAQEHYCTAVTQSIMGSLLPSLFGAPRCGLKLLACCTTGELHELGLRMVTDFFELDGFDTYFVGANTAAGTAVQMAADLQVDLIAISTTMTPQVSLVRQAIAHFRQTSATASIPILVGGYPFKASPGLWKQVGADGFGNDAQEALLAAHMLLKLPGTNFPLP